MLHTMGNSAISCKSVCPQWRADGSLQGDCYECQDAKGSYIAVESKLMKDASSMVSRKHYSLRILAYQVSLAILLAIVALLSYTLAISGKIHVGRSVKLFQTASSVTMPVESTPKSVRKALVISSLSTQNISWIPDIPPDWEVHRYILDNPDPSSSSTVPRNQGREAMAYLTYIIDHYDNLPDFTVFIHGHYRSWHQPEPLPLKLSALNLTALSAESYINLRCQRDPGCSSATYISATHVLENETRIQAKLMPGFWKTVFPASSDHWGMGSPPEAIGVPCCAQFAVSKAAIQLRSLEFWKMFRMPLTRDMKDYEKTIGSGLNGYTIGMLYEKVWHIVFGKDAIYCPDEEYCRQIQWSNGVTCDRYTGDFADSIGWENITCSVNG